MITQRNMIIAVKNTLDTVTVQGIENMRKMVLCYDTLEHIEETMVASEKVMEDDAKEDSANG